MVKNNRRLGRSSMFTERLAPAVPRPEEKPEAPNVGSRMSPKIGLKEAELQWVCDNYGDPEASAENAPSIGAWSLLIAAREDVKVYLWAANKITPETYLQKIEGREEGLDLTRIEKMLVEEWGVAWATFEHILGADLAEAKPPMEAMDMVKDSKAGAVPGGGLAGVQA
jgi:hypothetical protein